MRIMPIALSLLCISAVNSYDQAEYTYMDQLALNAGTDKSSAFHNSDF